jgi:hypothetical protein
VEVHPAVNFPARIRRRIEQATFDSLLPRIRTIWI